MAQTVCVSAYRRLTDTGENSNVLRYVSTAEDFSGALQDGVRHVVVTQHLDLSSISKRLPTSTSGVAETTSTASIQVPLPVASAG